MQLDAQERGCLCKKPYRYRSWAMSQLQKMKKNLGKSTLNVYRCRWCKLYHIGNAHPKKPSHLRSDPVPVQTTP